MKKIKIHRLGAVVALAVLLLLAAWVPWSRYTDLGIFVGGGGAYWVRQAAASPSDEEATAHLRRVLEATRYGVNTVENAVKDLPSRTDRVRLWRLLIRIAPNESWRKIYAQNLEREQTSS